MNLLLKNTTLYLIANLLPQLVSFLLLPLYSYYLTPAQFGIVSAMVVFQGLITIFMTLSLESSVIRLYWDYESEDLKKKFLGSVYLTIIIISIVMIGVAFLLSSFLQKVFKDIDFYPYYSLTIFTTFFTILTLVPNSYLRLKHKANLFMFISILQSLFTAGLTIFFVIYSKEQALGVIKGKMFGILLVIPLLLYISYKNFHFRIAPDMVKKSLAFSLPIIPILLASWVVSGTDRIFIADQFNLNDVGIYSLSVRIASLISLVSGAFMLAYHPLYYELCRLDNDSTAYSQLYTFNNVFIVVIIMVYFSISFFSKEIIEIFLAPKYHVCYKYVPFAAISATFNSISSTIMGASFQQSKKMKQAMYIGLGNAGITILLNMILIRFFGLAGAIMVTIISSIYLILTCYFYTKKNCFFISFNLKLILPLFIILTLLIIIFAYVIDIDNLLLRTSIKSSLFLFGIIYFLKKYWNFIKRIIFFSHKTI